MPAGWLTFADGVVYKPYGEQPVRVWGLSVTTDQQLAGAIMKIGGSIFLWTIIIYLWFKRFSASHATTARLPSGGRDDADGPRSSATTTTALTYDDVEMAFARTVAPHDPAD